MDIGFGKKTADFEFKLDDADAFIESGNPHNSEFFFGGSLAWYFCLKTKVIDGDKFISIFLYPKDCAGGVWSIEVNYDVLLLSESGGHKKEFDIKHNFTSNPIIGWGLPKFISITDLRAGGCINDNKIKIIAHLEFGELIRSE